MYFIIVYLYSVWFVGEGWGGEGRAGEGRGEGRLAAVDRYYRR